MILAGGFGTRLRPLSCSRPKLLFPIAGRTMIECILSGLSENGVDMAILATNYMSDTIRKHLGRKFEGVKLFYSLEHEPLGTGGAIKKAEKFFKKSEDFIVFNGDIISFPPIKEILNKHVSNKAITTIMLHKVKDPTHFGVVELGKSTRILNFVEKPSLENTPSKWINAGVYIMNTKAFDYIVPNKKISIERDVFPKLAISGKLFSHKYKGEWFDIGRFNEYRKANSTILSRISKHKPVISNNTKINENSNLIPPLSLNSNSIIRQNAIIGPNVSIGKNVVIGERSKISNSILFDHVIIGRNSNVRGAIIGEGVVIGNRVRIQKDCVIGDHVYISDNVALKKNIQICPHKEIKLSIEHEGVIV
ncbi:sugar phosphate nucleotidyltransferase [[Eubacterium] cellulosolvens]